MAKQDHSVAQVATAAAAEIASGKAVLVWGQLKYVPQGNQVRL